jgi:hypothetical protein
MDYELALSLFSPVVFLRVMDSSDGTLILHWSAGRAGRRVFWGHAAPPIVLSPSLRNLPMQNLSYVEQYNVFIT